MQEPRKKRTVVRQTDRVFSVSGVLRNMARLRPKVPGERSDPLLGPPTLIVFGS